jgi:hypothetical protein
MAVVVDDNFESYGLGSPAASGLDANWTHTDLGGAGAVTVSTAQAHSGTKSVLATVQGDDVLSPLPAVGAGATFKIDVWFYHIDHGGGSGGNFGIFIDPADFSAGLAGIFIGPYSNAVRTGIAFWYFKHGVKTEFQFPTGMPLNTWTKYTLEGKMSTVNGTYVDPDGYLIFSINDVVQAFVTGEHVTALDDADFPSATNPWGNVRVAWSGHIDDIRIEDDVEVQAFMRVAFGNKSVTTADRAILVNVTQNAEVLNTPETIKLVGNVVIDGPLTVSGGVDGGDDPRRSIYPLGGSRSTAIFNNVATDAQDYIDFVPRTGEFTGATVQAVVEVRTLDGGTSVTPKIRNLTDSTDAIIGLACTATNADYSGTNQRQTLGFTPVAGKRYRLMLTPSNATNGVYGIGFVEAFF